ncbi:MAG: hypothetical protein R8J94_20755 [Acidimicrobiia bacterium]|nr:hypothetical protein [Acidimicrobiia bacterium]
MDELDDHRSGVGHDTELEPIKHFAAALALLVFILMFMNVTVRQIEGRRMPPQAKRAAVALVLVSPIFVSILVRRSLRGGGPVFVYVGITFAMLLLVAVS